MAEIGAFEAKTHFSKLLERAEKGEEITITRRGKPVAKIVPAAATHDVAKALASIKRVRERAKARKLQITPEEIKEYINEGREY